MRIKQFLAVIIIPNADSNQRSYARISVRKIFSDRRVSSDIAKANEGEVSAGSARLPGQNCGGGAVDQHDHGAGAARNGSSRSYDPRAVQEISHKLVVPGAPPTKNPANVN